MVTHDKIRSLQNTMGYHNRCLFLAFPTGKAAKFGPEVRPFRMARCMRTFHEDCPKPLIPFTRAATFTLARTLIIAWAELRARAEMLGRGKPCHIHANFRDEIVGGLLTDAWDGIQQRDHLGKR